MVQITAPFSPKLGSIVIYQAEDGRMALDVQLRDETGREKLNRLCMTCQCTMKTIYSPFPHFSTCSSAIGNVH
jgi:hypothetical protein